MSALKPGALDAAMHLCYKPFDTNERWEFDSDHTVKAEKIFYSFLILLIKLFYIFIYNKLYGERLGLHSGCIYITNHIILIFDFSFVSLYVFTYVY